MGFINTHAGLRILLTPLGQQALSAALALEPREVDFLPHLSLLRRTFSDEIARPALELAILRREAASKFPRAFQMYFTREALEQASSHAVSHYRLERFRGFESILDLGCSIGGDTLSLACAAPTIGVDFDPLRLAMAQLNLRLGCHNDPSDSQLNFTTPLYETAFIQADLRQPLPILPNPKQAIFFDPSRRESGRRIHSVDQYHPPLKIIRSWFGLTPSIGVKISPGVKLSEIQEYDAEVEFISLNGELKEAVLWFGPLTTARRRATLLPGPFSLTNLDDEVNPRRPLEDGSPPLPISEPQSYILEPDPAILRARLVRSLGAKLGASQLDTEIAYLTLDRAVETPFAAAYQVEDWLPFNLKRLRGYLRQRNIEQVTIKKRGSPLEPEALIRELHLTSGKDESAEERIIILTHLKGRPIVIICLPRR